MSLCNIRFTKLLDTYEQLGMLFFDIEKYQKIDFVAQDIIRQLGL